MAKINLLPSDLGPNASVLKILSLIKKIAVVMSIVFFVFGTMVVGYTIFLRVQLTSSVKRSEGYKASITNLKSTEQSMYLLKERVQGIKKLLAKQIREYPLNASSGFLTNHSGVILTQVATSLDNITVSGSSSSSASIGDFFESMVLDNSYKGVKLTSFVFNPKSGYLFNLDINLK